VPKTSSGKVQHQACRAAYISGTLSVIESSVAGPSDYKESDWNQQSITREEILASGTAQEGRLRLEGYLQEQVARVLELAPPQVPLRQSLTSLGLDSLKSMELQNSIETGLDVFLPMASFLQDTNISELATLLMAELEKSIPGATLEVDRSQDLRADRPLSFGQQRLWFLDQLEPGNPAYNISTAFRFDGQLNAFALGQAIAEIVARHEALRTTFRANRGEPAQIISPLLTIMLPVVDLASIAETALDSQSIPLAAEEARRKFDLLDGPLIRTTLVRRSEQDHILFLTLHHIVSDAWSLGIFLRELEALYTAYARGNPSPLPELPAQYLDFAVWQRQRADALRVQLSFWKQTFITPPAQLELPLARPRPVRPTSRGACHWLTLSGDLSDKLKALSRQENCTLFMTLLAGFYVVLHGYTGQSDISLGSPIAGRNRAEFEKLIGFFVNTLILRADLSGNPTFRQLLGRVRQLALQSYANQDLPFEQVVSAVAPDRNTDHSPLYSVWFGLHAGSLPTLTLPAVDMIPIETDTQTIKVDLAVHLSDKPEGIAGKLEYNKDLFEAATIASLSEDFESVLTGATAQPDLRLNALEASLLVGVRRHRVREAENYENALHQKLKSTRRRVVPG
jgi:hypothetical protein